MIPIQTPPETSESAVDMSPEAIKSRLEMVGQLNDLCHFLASGTILRRDEIIEPTDRPTLSATTVVQTPHSERRPRNVQPSSESIIAEQIK